MAQSAIQKSDRSRVSRTALVLRNSNERRCARKPGPVSSMANSFKALSNMTYLKASGGCYCGNIRVVASFSQEFAAYNPRACDCDFCMRHGAAYVSDPLGSLALHIGNDLEVNRFRQGSNTAEMLLCRTCGVMVGALYRESNRLFGTLNFKALDSRPSFGPEQGVSPKLLSPDQKVRRWCDLWFPDVLLNIERRL